jgi:nucleotide-binding universal stress UspA family protein
MNTILVGTDSSAAADLAVDDAARLARDRGAELLVLFVRADHDLRTVVDPDRAPDPAARICAVAADEKAETIVVGNRGAHGGWWRVRDSVPNMVLRHSPCSVLIVDTRKAQ